MSTKTASTNDRTNQRITELEEEVAALRRVLDSKRTLKDMFKRYAGAKQRTFIEEKMAGVSDSNSVWLAIHAFLDFCILDEHNAARDHGLSNEAVRYNLGRESGLEDFKHRLLELWANANRIVKA